MTTRDVRKRWWFLGVAVGLVAVVVVGVLSVPALFDWLDGSTYGTAKGASELPEFSEIVGSLHPEGRLEYRYIKDGVAGHLVVSGVAQLEAVEAFAAANGFEFFEHHQVAPSLREKLRKYRGRQTGIRIDFGDEDSLVLGSRPFFDLELHYRRSDHVFTMSVAREFAH